MLDIDLDSLSEISTENLAKVKKIKSNDIAIIGLAGYFPKAEDVDQFWNNLIEGLDCVDVFPEKRSTDMNRYLSNYRPELYDQGYDIGSYLAQIDRFDYGFFKMSPNEAALMDPSQRLFLQTGYHAIEDAGYSGDKLAGSNTGVYLGYNADALFAYRNLIMDIHPDRLAMAVPGNLTSVISGRISYLLDLKGPSISVDTACSSSLVAVHLACQALRSGDCNMALAGSVRINMLPVNRSQKLGIESSDGITRTFDDKSDGTGNGEGTAVIMLKPLADAVKDKDHIYAVIKGSAVNQDGNSIGITAPNVKAQEEVILRAWRNAEVDPETISYIEAHGTGTKLGDPIEIDAITRAFAKHTERKQFCAIGSVKTNMGHLDNAAGMAGMAKATLALHKGIIPPHIHFETPNSKIDFENSPVYVNTQVAPWKTEGMPRRCGVSAFGLSGTNCHIIMEEAPEAEEVTLVKDESIVTISAKTPTALEALITAYQGFEYTNSCTVEKIAYTTQTGRGHYKYRLAIITHSLDDFKHKLSQITQPYHALNVPDVFFTQAGGESQKRPEEVVGLWEDTRKIAEDYIEGRSINWEAFYRDYNPGKTSLPVYPFDRTRCWIELPELVVNMPLAESFVAATAIRATENTVVPLGREDGNYTWLETNLVQIYGEVLGFEEINIEDDFYDLGGDSIIAMKIVKLIEDRTGIKTDMSELLECIGIMDYSEFLQERVPKAAITNAIEAHSEVIHEQDEEVHDQIEEDETVYCEASAAQKRIFVISQNEELSTSYNITNAIKISGKIDVKKVENVFKEMIKRHESLRTSFEIVDGEIMQVIHRDVDFKIDYYEVQTTDVHEIMNTFVKVFDLNVAPLFRVGLVKCEEDQHLFIFDCSHIISDGFSVNIINQEFIRLYLGNQLEPMAYQYRDYTLLQTEMKQSDLYQQHKLYWMEKLSGELPLLSLPNDYPRPVQADMRGAVHRFKINKPMLEQLNTLAAKNSATLFMVLLAAYNVLLSKYCRQEDIIVGTPISGRNNGSYDNVIGMFVNTLALRNYPEGNKTFEMFLQQVKQTTLEAYKHEAFQFDDVVMSLDVKRDPSRNPVFDTMFALQNLGFNEFKLQDLCFSPYEMHTETSRFDLMFNAVPVANGIDVNIEYSTALFREETICAMAEHFLNILKCITDNQEVQLCTIKMLSEQEMSQYISDEWINKVAYPLEKTLVEVFLEQVERIPESIAVVSCGKTLTYEQLNRQSDDIAQVIMEQGLNKGDIVAVVLERGVETIASIMAVLKAGCAYLPIDIAYPQERIDYILEDSGAKLVITHDLLRDVFIQSHIHTITPTQKVERETYWVSDRIQQLSSVDSAYVIYTSGSTGNPKGVVVEHRSVINFIGNLNKQYGGAVNESDRFLAITNICFDVSVCEVFLSLCFGAQLHFYRTEGVFDVQELSEYIASEGITYTYLPPALLADMSVALKQTNTPIQLNKMLVGVEPIKDLVLAEYLKLNEDMIIVNGYGPTEATVCATFYIYEPHHEVNRIVPIGTALDNTNVYLLDASLNPVPIGVQGEICISGVGLARGYLNRQDLTEQKFRNNPFIEGERLYCTGDMGRMLPDGNIQFSGRVDDQVKIRGYRVELGEIESKVKELTGVRQAVVIDQCGEDGVKYLCAYLVCEEEITLTEIRAELKTKLPDYMIPSYFVPIDKIPLTSNGKTDKKALPEVDGHMKTGVEYAPPENNVQEQIVTIWKTELNAEKIGIDDNFFDLGGHSLKATMIVSKIQKQLDVKIPLGKFMELLTIREIAEYVDGLDKTEYIAIKQVPPMAYYPLAAAQRTVFLQEQFEGVGTSYHIPLALRISGKLDEARVNDALEKLVANCEILRTSFHLNDELIQVVQQDIVCVAERRACSPQDIDAEIIAFIRPFNLDEPPLMRVMLLDPTPDEQLLVFDIHHIISDGISIKLLMAQFVALYCGEEIEIPTVQYKDYAVWQNELMQSESMLKQKTFWHDLFADKIPVVDFNTDFPRKSGHDFEGGIKNVEIEAELVKALENMSKKMNISMNSLCFTAYAVLLQKYCGESEFVIGSLVAGRTTPDVEHMIGMFNNYLPIRVMVDEQTRLDQLLQSVALLLSNCYDNQDYPYDLLAEDFKARRSLSRNPFFDTMMIYHNEQDEMALPEIEGVKTELYEIKNHTAKLDFKLDLYHNEDVMSCVWEYSTGLYAESSIERMATHYIKLLEEMVKNAEKSIHAYSVLTKEEEGYILGAFNDTKVSYSEDKTLDMIFEEQVIKTPDAIAIGFDNQTLTFSELNKKANNLAKVLRNTGVKGDSIVGVMAERSMEMMVGILAVVKAGGAYMPISPDYPVDRISYMLEDSQAVALLTQERFIEKMIYKNVINLDDAATYEGAGENLAKANNPQSLAYVIYTSGSTGKPKGVMIEHTSAINRIEWMQKKYPIGEVDKILQKTPFTFDVSVWELFWWMFTGTSVYFLKPEGEKDPSVILEAIEKQKITTMHFVPSMLALFLEYYEMHQEEYDLSSLKQVFASGEALTIGQVEKFNKLLYGKNQTRLYNLYGPTEATVDVSYYDCPVSGVISNVPIGKPIDNTRLYVLDKQQRLQPVGVAGELYISGIGVARGYLNRPELTSEKFMEDPYCEGYKMYRSGDLTKWLENGDIEYLGRIDNQVKIRGLRIELGEIEARLGEQDSIHESAVTVREDESGSKYLCGYYTGTEVLSVEMLRKHITEKLPDYMVPSYFVKLEQMPLSANGKLDRKMLPEPEGRVVTSVEYRAAENEIEEKLVRIWQTLLGGDKVGIDDNFFDLGGHSLKAARMTYMIKEETGVEVPLTKIFEMPSIRELAVWIECNQKMEQVVIERAEEKEYYSLSSAQYRMYVLQKLSEDMTTYNLPFVLAVEGYLDRVKVEKALKQLVERHESLRTSFHMIDGEVVQKIHDAQAISIPIFYSEQDGTSIEEEIKRFVRPFDMEKAPLMHAGIIKISNEKYILMFDMHHIISDGRTGEIISEEFVQLYGGKELAELKMSYKDFSEWQSKRIDTDETKAERDYWIAQFEGELPVLALPYDYQRPSVQSFEGDEVAFTIDEQLVKKLEKLAAQTGTTLYMILLSAYQLLLSKYSGQEDIIVGVPVSGRTTSEMNETVGMFVNTLALRGQMTGDMTYIEFLNTVKQTVLKGIENQNMPFEELVEKVVTERDMSRNPLFDTILAFQSYDVNDVTIDELTFTPVKLKTGTAKLDLALSAVKKANSVECSLEYCVKLFKDTTIKKMAYHYLTLLELVTEQADKKLSTYQMLSKEEIQTLKEFNDTTYSPRKETVIELFEEKAEAVAGHLAISCQSQSITYGELNRKANTVAKMLREQGIKQEDIVGIMMDNSIEMAIAFFAILKAGGAFMPINPHINEERARFMIEDSGAKIIFQNESRDMGDCKTILLPSYVELDQTIENLKQEENGEALAYVIYTSGTTGLPKGVMIEQKSFTNNIQWHGMDHQFSSKSCVLQTLSNSFDAFLLTFYSALINGAHLVLPTYLQTTDMKALGQLIDEYGINHIAIPPVLLEQLLEQINQDTARGIQSVTVGGDSLTANLIELAATKNPDMVIVNEYGPTESTVIATRKRRPDKGNVTIGSPVGNTRIYILDSYLNLVPQGVVGEIYISGDGLARGYLKREKLTLEQFIPNPFESGNRMYRTGDLGKWIENGEIVFGGRVDYQVKIRGYRIELGEIETNLLKIHPITQAVVVDRQDEGGSKYLCAYIVCSKEPDRSAVREQLRQLLPEYMIPAYILVLEQLPVSGNGKINRKALPAPEVNQDESVEYVAPQNDIEMSIASVWETVLKLERVSSLDNFTYLGGDSIKAIQVVGRLADKGYTANVRDIIESSNVRELSGKVKKTQRIYDQTPIEGYIEMIPVQTCFFEFDYVNMHIWNVSSMFYMKNGFDEQMVRKIFEAIVIHHDALRMVFKQEDGKRKQYNRGINEQLFDLTVYDVTEYEDPTGIIEKHADEIQASISLEQGPLVKLGLFKARGCDYLLFVVHHLIMDFTSMQVIQEDIITAYSQLLAHELIKLPEKTASFKDWSDSIQRFAKSKELLEELEYWTAIDKATIKTLPKDHYDVNRQVNKQTHMSIEMSQVDTEAIISSGMKKYNASPNELLLSGLGEAFKAWCGNDAIRMRIAGNGKNWCYDELDISRTVGWFSISYPAVIDASLQDQEENLKSTLATLRSMPENGCGYDILRYITLPEQADKTQFDCEPELFFNYLGIVEDEIQVEAGDFGLSDMPMGVAYGDESESVYNFDFSAFILHGKLVVRVAYLETEYDEATVRALLEIFMEKLKSVAV